MSNINISLNLNISSTSSQDIIPPILKFWLYLIFHIPSFFCTLFVLYHLLFDRTLRRSLNNHVIIVLLFTVLFCEVTNYPWMLYYYYHTTWQKPYVFCVVWGFIDWAVYMLQLLLFAWASIERHILIFHDQWVSTKRKRFWIHYFPLIFILLYWFIFYTFVYFYPTCQNQYDSTNMICMDACLFDIFSFRAFETFVNNIIPSLTIVISSVLLLLRVFRQKYRMCQQIQWRKHRKMTIQLLWIAVLYLLITSPWAIIIFLRLCGLPPNIGAGFENIAVFLSYYIVLLFPFVSLLSLPELYNKLKKICHRQPRQKRIKREPIPARNNQVTPL
ncbi:unnamed protein product [Adineta steineri]|uniref:G-protein coupled receptors family 1 profile domain-containing protein n=1 Tax=Adineta steineri TaxID=433720 RepID=A0A815F5R5_9BILA|nr:unnamed protein product [Adineta steineri]CAF1584697.1 unnamed protein product [Adineta steineri]